LVLIDDGSDDNTVAICESYMKKDKRIKLVSNDSNKGVAYSRNHGLDAATGEYLIFVDSDDFIASCYIELLLGIALEHSCQLVQCKMRWECTPDTEDDYDKNAHYFMTIHTDRADASRALQDGRDSRFGGMVCAKLYHRRLFEGVRFPIGKVHEDEAVTHRLIYNADRSACISASIYYYVKSSSSISERCFFKKTIRYN
jgi:glycosyltransferase involved in cell wall biosynthesis